jgi:drug/metabolite transporter (DMT)-like permease
MVGTALVMQLHRVDFLRVNLRGILFALLAGLSMAIYILFGKRALARYAPWTVVLYAFTAGGLFLAVWSGPRLLPALRYPGVAWLWILGLALVPSLGGYALYTLGLHDLPASQASIIATWEVVTAAFLGWLVFSEHLTAVQYLGAALVCLGIGWIQRTEA